MNSNTYQISKKRIRLEFFDYLNYTLLIIFAVLTAYPLYFVLIGSFTNGNAYMSGGIWLWPKNFTLSNYTVILSDPNLWYALRNTVVRTIFGTILSLLFTALVAYAMHRKELKFRGFFQTMNLITMFFGGGLIPYFVLIVYLNLYDNFLVYIIPSLYSVYNMIIISSFYSSISNELHEAAVIDGAGEVTIWWKIYMPLSKSVLATVGLWSAIGHWNSYFSTMIYTSGGKNVITLQYYLLGVINKANYTIGDAVPPSVIEEVTSTTVSYAAIIVATIPILFIYPILQRYFTKGVAVGSLKG